MSTSSAKQAKHAKSDAKLAKREAKLAKQKKKEASRKKKLANAPLKYDFHEAFFYTRKTPKEDKKGHKTGEAKQKTSKGATLIDPKAAALLTTGTLQWFEYQTRNIAEQRTSKFDKKTLKNINTLDRFFHSNVEIDALKSQFAQVTVAITSERVAFFKRAHKAWKQLKLKCQEISEDFGKRDSDLPLVGFKDAKRKTSGPLGRHIKIINKFFQQYASYVKYRAEWKEKVLGKQAAVPVSVEIREQMSFQTEDDYQSSGEDSESAEESANSKAESANSDEESEDSDSSSGESAQESAAEQSPKAAAKKKPPKKSDLSDTSEESAAEQSPKAAAKKKSPKKSDSDSSDSSEESAEEQSPKAAAKKKSPKKTAVLLPNVHGKKQEQLFQKAKEEGAKHSPSAEEKARFEFQANLKAGTAHSIDYWAGTAHSIDATDSAEKPLRHTPKSKKKKEYTELELEEITLADGAKVWKADNGRCYNTNDDEVGTWDEETNLLLRRTPKPKRGYDEIASDNKRASNKKKKKRRKKNKKSKGSPSAATP